LLNRPRLVCVPSADNDFALTANTLLARLVASGTSELSPDAFADKLRHFYPAIAVRERQRLADDWPVEGPVWYVIRREYSERISALIDIPSDREHVFSCYVGRMPEWQIAVRLQLLHTRAGLVGTEYAADYEAFGHTFHFRLRLVDADSPRSVRVEAEGLGVILWYLVTFSDIAEGTRIDVSGDYVLPSRLLSALVDPLALERRIVQDIDRAHAALRELCLAEQSQGGVPAFAGQKVSTGNG
jgi:hypothetical protein